MSSTILEVPISLDEVRLSMGGYEIQDARARIVSSPYDGKFENELHLSISGRFDRMNIVQEFDDSYAPALVPVLLIPLISKYPFTFYLRSLPLQDANKPIRISTKESLGETVRRLTESDVRISFTTFEGSDLSTALIPVGNPARNVPVTFAETRLSCGCQYQHVEIVSFISDAKSEWSTPTLQLSLTCAVNFCDFKAGVVQLKKYWEDEPPMEADGSLKYKFSHILPNPIVEIIDAKGFILAQKEAFVSMEIASRSLVPTQVRPARWIFTHSWEVGDLAGSPDRIVIRVNPEEENLWSV